MEVEKLRRQLSHEKASSVRLKDEIAEAKKSATWQPGALKLAEEQAVMMKKNMSWIESTSQNQYSAIQQQYASLQNFNNRLHEKNLSSMKSEYLQSNLKKKRERLRMRHKKHGLRLERPNPFFRPRQKITKNCRVRASVSGIIETNCKKNWRMSKTGYEELVKEQKGAVAFAGLLGCCVVELFFF